ncbi:MAG TPA: hypothetical protein VGK89_01200 [Candidatus Eisenbacteria bacterium]|jgi:hypothetical protein
MSLARLVALPLRLSLAPAARAQLVLDASPETKVENNALSTMRRVLSKKERMEHRVTIIHRHGRCYWTSRENRELVRSVSGAFQYFTPTNGGGYLKMLDTHSLPDSVRSWGPRFRYMDHLSIMLGTITCSGTSGKCAPDGAE